MKTVPLANTDMVATVDDDDYDRVSQYGWCLFRAGESGQKFYAQANIKTGDRWKRVLLHRFLFGPDHPQCDHVNGNGLDNRRSNLRPATSSQNQYNRGPWRGRRFKGVSWHRSGRKWVAQICSNRRKEYLGLFPTEEEAARAYDRRARELHGEFARLNYPEDRS